MLPVQLFELWYLRERAAGPRASDSKGKNLIMVCCDCVAWREISFQLFSDIDS